MTAPSTPARSSGRRNWARGVVLKLFIDQRKTAEGDRALAQAMKKTKVILQARLNDAEPEDNPLPERFRLALPHRDDRPISARDGWMPLPELSAAAHDIGFCEFNSPGAMPIVKYFRDRYAAWNWRWASRPRSSPASA